jgi:hypothetical protein
MGSNLFEPGFDEELALLHRLQKRLRKEELEGGCEDIYKSITNG